MQVKDIMNRKVEVININKRVQEAAQMMESGGYGAIPVEEDDKMVGMITDRDIALRLVAKNKDPRKTKIKECMSSGIEYCFEEDDVGDLAMKMKSSRHRRIPVINKEKRLVGIVSLREIAKVGNENLTHTTFDKICG